MMERDAVVGVTSNPTIFQKAIAEGNAYDEQLKELLGHEDDLKEIFLALSADDIKDALALLRPAFDASDGEDGCVSWEVDPEIAFDRDRTLRGGEAAARVDRRAEPLREDPGDGRRASARSRTPSPTAATST